MQLRAPDGDPGEDAAAQAGVRPEVLLLPPVLSNVGPGRARCKNLKEGEEGSERREAGRGLREVGGVCPRPELPGAFAQEGAGEQGLGPCLHTPRGRGPAAPRQSPRVLMQGSLRASFVGFVGRVG